jgi:hypothetical protein
MYACLRLFSVLSCVQVAALRRAHPPYKVFCRLWKDKDTEKAAKVQYRVADP